MSYQRVIPRDLFNEANLLKCYGKLCLELDRWPDSVARLEHYGNAFIIEQDPNDGSLTVYNIRLIIGNETYVMSRPLNSREPWPLYCHLKQNDDVLAVFNDEGELSDEFLGLLPPL